MNTYQLNLRYFSNYTFQMIVFLPLSALGILLGIMLSVRNSALACGLDIVAFSIKPTYVCLLAVNLIPVIILVCLLASSLKLLCCLWILLYSIYYGFAGMLFFLAFGSGAWLIRFLACFSSSVTTVLMWWLLIRNINLHHANLPKDICLSITIVFAITITDFRIIVPFLSNMLVQ